MLRRLAAVVACVTLLAAVPTGSLYVTTLPSGADVWIDGTYVGRSPIVLGGLAVGRHTVGLTKTGWTPRQVDVSVLAAQTTLSSSKLEQARAALRTAPGTIAIHGIPADQTTLDGLPAVPSKEGIIATSAGTHELAVRTPRGRITRAVTVWPQTRTDVVLQPDVELPGPSIVAPAEDYVPRNAIRLVGERVLIRYGGHEVIGRMGATTYRLDGKPIDYGAAPTTIGRRIYLPLDLLTTISSGTR